MKALYPLFFISGFPALLYQMVWQRSLFSIFGTNIESVTAVVAAFMLGLGLGGLLGGRLSLLPTHRLLFVFAIIEAGIGVTGLISLPVFHWVGAGLTELSVWQTGTLAFLLVSVPTTLMGATLPILTAYFTRRLNNVGQSVGALYLVNALGSAAACFAAGYWLMHHFGQQGTVWIAAVLNFIVAGGALIIASGLRKASAEALSGAVTAHSYAASAPSSAPISSVLFPRTYAWALALGAGFISLSLEILWLRAYSFVSASFAPVTTYVIGCYLLGIALGSWVAEWLAARWAPNSRKLTLAMFVTIIGASVYGFALPPMLAHGATVTSYWWLIALVTPGAALWGALLPLLAHVAVAPDDHAGEGLGGIYAANIVGAVAGTLLTGFVWMDYAGTAAISLSLALLGLCMAWLWLLSRAQSEDGAAESTGVMIGKGAVLVVLGILMTVTTAPLFRGYYDRLMDKEKYSPDNHFAVEIENRSGVVHVTKSGTVYGGGAYDGKVNTRLDNDINGVHRAFAVSAFHEAPKRVLMVGLASGSWARIVADHPQVEFMQVVEINKGYYEAIRQYPEVADVLTHPKVKITIDDGRRWIHNHNGGKFDLVIMNTTWHWRAYASTILSADFLQLTKRVLAPGGMVYYNATYAPEVHRTALEVFPHSMRYSNMVLASDSPIKIDLVRWERVLRDYRMRNAPVLAWGTPQADEVFEAAKARFSTKGGDEWNSIETREEIIERTKTVRVITDDNMGTEWAPGR